MVKSAHLARDNDDQFINPRNQWGWAERFAVKMLRPAVTAQTPGKAETVAQLANWQATSNPWMTLGYKQEYAYIPQFPFPYSPIWVPFARYLTGQLGEDALKEASKWVFVAPSAANMISKTVENLNHKVPVTPPDVRAAVKKLFTIRIPSDAFVFPKRDADRTKWQVQAVNNVVEWLTHDAMPDGAGHFSDDAPYPLKDTSPGLPWILMKPEQGTTYGHGHNPKLLGPLFLNKDSVARRFLGKMLLQYLDGPHLREIWAINAAGASTATVEEAKARIMELGRRFYTSCVSSLHPTVDSGGEKPSNFKAHLMYNQLAGNVKPVLADEIAQGKPNRSVYSTAALLRLLGTRMSHLAYEYLESPYAEKKFSFVKGGAARLTATMLELLDVESLRDAGAHRHSEVLRNVEAEDVLWFAPDVKAMDMHSADDNVEDFHRHDLAGSIPLSSRIDLEQVLLLMCVGVLEESIVHPVVLFVASTEYRPTHLNTSGNAFVYLINQRRATAVGAVLTGDGARLMDAPHSPDYQIRWNNEAHPATLQEAFAGDRTAFKAWGDDMLIGVRIKPRVTAAGQKLYVNSREESGRISPGTTAWLEPMEQVNGRNRPLWYTADQGKGVLLEHVEKILGLTFKPETLGVYRSLSTPEVLGHHLVFSTEFSDSPTILAARPLAKILFSSIWPKHMPGSGSTLTPHTYALLRLTGAMLEAAHAYPEAVVAIQQAFASTLRVAAGVDWTNQWLVDQFNVDVGNPYVWGFDEPSKVLAELLGFKLGRLPTREQVWELQTGVVPPRAQATAEEISDGSEEIDMALLGDAPVSSDTDVTAHVDLDLLSGTDQGATSGEAVDH